MYPIAYTKKSSLTALKYDAIPAIPNKGTTGTGPKQNTNFNTWLNHATG